MKKLAFLSNCRVCTKSGPSGGTWKAFECWWRRGKLQRDSSYRRRNTAQKRFQKFFWVVALGKRGYAKKTGTSTCRLDVAACGFFLCNITQARGGGGGFLRAFDLDDWERGPPHGFLDQCVDGGGAAHIVCDFQEPAIECPGLFSEMVRDRSRRSRERVRKLWGGGEARWEGAELREPRLADLLPLHGLDVVHSAHVWSRADQTRRPWLRRFPPQLASRVNTNNTIMAPIWMKLINWWCLCHYEKQLSCSERGPHGHPYFVSDLGKRCIYAAR